MFRACCWAVGFSPANYFSECQIVAIKRDRFRVNLILLTTCCSLETQLESRNQDIRRVLVSYALP